MLAGICNLPALMVILKADILLSKTKTGQ